MKATSLKSRSVVGSIHSLLSRKYLAWVAAIVLPLSAGICAAHTLTVTAQSLDTNSVLFTSAISPIASSGCGKETVATASEIIYKGQTYEFLFWNINATLYTSRSVSFEPLCDSNNTAAAWYWVICTDSSKCEGSPATTDSTLAFSLDDNTVIAGVTPIGEVTVGLWTPGSLDVTPPATIFARPALPEGVFAGWLVLPDQSMTNSTELMLDVPDLLAVAFYKAPPVHICALCKPLL